jgi:nucleoside-diphosphate-sugar epimerase
MSAERIALVVGGGGFIGQATCAALARLGMTPVIADMRPGPDDAIPFHACDITDAAGVRAVIDEVRPEAVLHLAALLSTDTIADLQLGLQVNVVGMQNVLDAATHAGVPRFVYASSIAVYGDQSQWGDHAVSEEDFAEPVLLYGFHKMINEATARHYQEAFGIRCVGLRISTVYGAGRKTGMSAPVNALIEGAVTGEADCVFGPKTDSCMCHVDDIATELATLAWAPAPKHDVYNAGGEFSTIGQLAGWISELRPDADIRLGPDDSRIPHVSLVDGSRITEEFGIQPRSFERWAKDQLEASMQRTAT